MVAPATQNATAPVKEGEVLASKYRIEGVIGVGGMGVVVSAMHLELDQRVALKFLLPQAAQNDELVGRFVREAKASVKLKGTHVAKVLDVGRMDDGRAYIVMEYLDGRDLGAELKASREQFEIKDAVSWMLQACEGLAEAHALGIVHRDLKPGNLFLTRSSDGKHLVKVLDFGISKSINPNSSDMLSLTKTEMLLGSPLYMAPEQMRSSKYVDERSDIWALGAIAYELLARRVPFEADTLLDLCFKVAQEGCPDVGDLRPEIPPELSDVVMRCLEKEPEQRWNDIGELANALEPFGHESDKGSAARTNAVLAGAERALRMRERKSDPGAAPPAVIIPDPKHGSDAKRISNSQRRLAAKAAGSTPVGMETTERVPVNGSSSGGAIHTTTLASPGTSMAPSQPSSAPVISVQPTSSSMPSPTATTTAADDASAPDAVPASSAWGTTNAGVVDKKKANGRRALFAAIPVAVGVLAIAVVISTRTPKPDTTTTSNPPAAAATDPKPNPNPTTTVSSAMTEPTPAPTPTPTTQTQAPSATTAAVAPPVRTAPTTGGQHAAPRPKASGSGSAAPPAAAPKPTSDFIRERTDGT
jgi:serine/threonine protein kinase